jgi:endogenous inhibitor of DNA gyrase (YacG/DUF329 family)
MKAKCPTCGGASERAKAGKVFPFCSARCWAIDLGRWLGEEYRVAEGDEQQPPSPRDPEA